MRSGDVMEHLKSRAHHYHHLPAFSVPTKTVRREKVTLSRVSNRVTLTMTGKGDNRGNHESHKLCVSFGGSSVKALPLSCWSPENGKQMLGNAKRDGRRSQWSELTIAILLSFQPTLSGFHCPGAVRCGESACIFNQNHNRTTFSSTHFAVV